MKSGLFQFFSYFGSKSKSASKYPTPLHGTIIEPFAGSAGYSCRHYQKEVRLYDVNPTIVRVWDYLIKATESDVLGLPLNPEGHSSLSQAEKDFIGFWWVRCSVRPGKRPVPWASSGEFESSFWSERTRRRIAEQVKFIKHWKVELKDYRETGDERVTWFIDPPYQIQGRKYPFNQIDYVSLSQWAKGRLGQVIVCESSGADWLPFEPLFKGRSVGKSERFTEVVYTQVNG